MIFNLKYVAESLKDNPDELRFLVLDTEHNSDFIEMDTEGGISRYLVGYYTDEYDVIDTLPEEDRDANEYEYREDLLLVHESMDGSNKIEVDPYSEIIVFGDEDLDEGICLPGELEGILVSRQFLYPRFDRDFGQYKVLLDFWQSTIGKTLDRGWAKEICDQYLYIREWRNRIKECLN